MQLVPTCSACWDVVCCYCQGYKILLWPRMKVWLFVEIEVEPVLHPSVQGDYPSVEVGYLTAQEGHLFAQQLPIIIFKLVYTILEQEIVHSSYLLCKLGKASFLQRMLHMVKHDWSHDNCMLSLELEWLVVQVQIKHTWMCRIRVCRSAIIRLLVELYNMNVSRPLWCSMSDSTLINVPHYSDPVTSSCLDTL